MTSDEWIRREIDWIGVPLKEKKPFLGICLGAQMLARTLAIASVRILKDASKSAITDRPDRARPSGLRLPLSRPGLPVAPRGIRSAKWRGSARKGRDFEAQAFRYGPAAFGLQFHPEVTLPMICRWSARSSERLDCPARARCIAISKAGSATTAPSRAGPAPSSRAGSPAARRTPRDLHRTVALDA